MRLFMGSGNLVRRTSGSAAVSTLNDTGGSVVGGEDADPLEPVVSCDDDDTSVINNNNGPKNSNISQLTCAFLAALTTGGTSYSFGLYGDALKKSLHLTQPQLDTISTANFCAGVFSWIPGLIVDNWGVRTGLVSGSLLGSSSLLVYWRIATRTIAVHHSWMLVPILSALGVLIFFSCALITGSVFKIIVSTTGAGSKGTAVGAAKGYVGLGVGVYASIFEALRSPTTSDLDFLPLAAGFFLVCVTLPALCLLPSNSSTTSSSGQSVPCQDESTPRHFQTLFASLLTLATIIIGQSLWALSKEDNDGTKSTTSDPNFPLALFLVAIWVGPIVGLQFLPKKSSLPVPPAELEEQEEGESLLFGADEMNPRVSMGDISLQRFHLRQEDDKNCWSAKQENYPEAILDPLSRQQDPAQGDNINDPELIETNKNLWQMLQTPTAWLMLWTMTILVGGGIVMTNNMGQMVESLNFPKQTTSASLAFYSVAQSGGRIITGALSESALNWNTKRFCIDNGIPRPFFLVLAAMAGLTAHLLLSLATSKRIFVLGTTLAGLAFGMVWPLMVLIVGEVFGTANVGANYMFFDGFTSAGGSLLLSKFVAQEVYESHIDRKDDPDNVTCLGSGCYAMTHVVCAALAAVCIITSLGVVKTTRAIYNRNNLHKRQSGN